MWPFRGKCQHDWAPQVKTFMPPRPTEFEMFDEDDKDFLERCAAGVTTVLLVCLDCGATEKHEMLGKEEPREPT